MKIRLPLSIGHANGQNGDPGYRDGPLASGSARERALGRSERSAGRVLATALFCLMVMGVQGAAAANIWVVDNDLIQCPTANYMSIQAAINAPTTMPGDTIKVCAGLYAEQVQINKNDLTLNGAQFGVDARTRPFVAANESIIDHNCGPVQILADNVTLDGFTIQGSNLPPNLFPMCLGAGIWTNPGFSGNQGGHKIRNSIVQDNIMGIFLNSNCTIPTVVQFNLIQNNNFAGPDSGNGIESLFGLCNATIDSNKFSGHLGSSVRVFSGATLDVTNNELVGGTPERISLGSVATGTISDNVSIGSTGVNGTIQLFGGDSNITINGNTLFNGVRGIRVRDLGDGPNSGTKAHFNCIDGNMVAGMQVDAGGHSGTLNAENNWWGSANGPTNPNNPGGTGDAVIDPDGVVDFIPFLKSCPTGASAPSMVTGGGQVNVMGGRGSFGFSAKQDTQSGHLDYMNHVTRDHLNCTVDAVMFLSAKHAKLSGSCTSNNPAITSFSADVEDNAKQGKNADTFKITYGTHVDEGGPGPIISGNIEIK